MQDCYSTLTLHHVSRYIVRLKSDLRTEFLPVMGMESNWGKREWQESIEVSIITLRTVSE